MSLSCRTSFSRLVAGSNLYISGVMFSTVTIVFCSGDFEMTAGDICVNDTLNSIKHMTDTITKDFISFLTSKIDKLEFTLISDCFQSVCTFKIVLLGPLQTVSVIAAERNGDE